MLPTLEQPTKCIATIQIDNEDLINRIKEDHEICRPHGEWITKHTGDWWSDFLDYKCSVCGKEYIRSDRILYGSNFCPHCGASMGEDMRGCDDDD